MNELREKARLYRNKYFRTKKGLTSRIYGGQKQSSKRRGHNPPEYTRDELFLWLITQVKFDEIYDRWVDSGYNKMLKPSVDRINNDLGYSFENIRITTWQENMDRAMKDVREGRLTSSYNPQRKVVQYDKKGKLLKTHLSINQASIDSGVDVGNIYRCCQGKFKQSGGFVWKFKESLTNKTNEQ